MLCLLLLSLGLSGVSGSFLPTANPIPGATYIVWEDSTMNGTHAFAENEQALTYLLAANSVAATYPAPEIPVICQLDTLSELLVFGTNRGDKRYELTNHLVNVMAVVSDKKLPVADIGQEDTVNYWLADVHMSQDYYPFGMHMEGRGIGEEYRFGFQNQEEDDEIRGDGNHINFKYRPYDPLSNRFYSSDPLASDFPWNSPYAFSENRVVDARELEGLELVEVNPKLTKDRPIYLAGIRMQDETAIHIIAHGTPSSFSTQSVGKIVKKSASVNHFKALLKQSNLYAEMEKSGDVTVVLHSCRTGRPSHMNDDGKEPIAQYLSRNTGYTIIAPDERDYFNTTYGFESGPKKTTFTDEFGEITDWGKARASDNYGNWVVYANGIMTAVYYGVWSPVTDRGVVLSSALKRDLKYRVTAPTLNLREGPGVGHATVGKALAKDAMIRPTGGVSEDGNWMEVVTEDARTGWVSHKHTEVEYPE